MGYCTLHFLFTKGVAIIMKWILAHVGVQRNEQVDTLAKRGLNRPRININLAYSLTELVSKVKIKTLQLENRRKEQNSSSKFRKFFAI